MPLGAGGRGVSVVAVVDVVRGLVPVGSFVFVIVVVVFVVVAVTLFLSTITIVVSVVITVAIVLSLIVALTITSLVVVGSRLLRDRMPSEGGAARPKETVVPPNCRRVLGVVITSANTVPPCRCHSAPVHSTPARPQLTRPALCQREWSSGARSSLNTPPS
ncbi:uncharacterized protein LOC125047236 isoform X2 [Penaeus chinensis]|uniref:uncharacterized protein LOC125047236 isoform X2 n=1 Tax=Penaeus chinensis TaxID=139456 RepID=UPI001FB59556|nr:uncharacterized protein LOC125047236 isoform X2 [Penaeus chinensis]